MYIVNGGTHGIGRACVMMLARRGERILAVGRDVAAGADLMCSALGIEFCVADLGDPEQIKVAVHRAMELGDGVLHGLVNNAGTSHRIPFIKADVEDWDRIMDVNARSAFLMTRYSLPGLIHGKGTVVNISSVAGKVGAEGLAIYCASKAAILGMTQALALEYGEHVRFNALCPGQVSTRMMEGVLADDARHRRLKRYIPAGRFGTPEEIASVVGWLLSPASSYVNGSVLTVDGGETAGLRALRDLALP